MSWPDDFQPLRKVEKILQDKVKLFNEEGKVDWATGELLAYGSLLLEGKDVRMSGQDVQRGTFSHRHAVLRDENTNEDYNRLSRLPDSKGEFRIFNSLLSEYGVPVSYTHLDVYKRQLFHVCKKRRRQNVMQKRTQLAA